MKRILTFRKKIILCILCIYSLFLICILILPKFNIPAKSVDCSTYSRNVNYVESKLLNETELNFLKFLNKYYSAEEFIKTGSWFPVPNDGYIYSSYFDYCPNFLQHVGKLCIKCIGFAKVDSIKSKPLNCTFNASSYNIGSGVIEVQLIPESHDKAYSAVNLFCVMKEFSHDKFQPDYVAILSSSDKSLWVPVKSLLSNEASKNQRINLCVRPLYGMIPFIRLVEFFTYYSVMGVDHFTIYHHNTSNPMQLFFKFLMNTNMSIDFLSWDIPASNDLIHEFGQLIFTQDCITQSKNRFTHTILVDFDEMVVPQNHHNIKALLQFLDEENPNAASYVIPMSLFCEEYFLEKDPTTFFHILDHNKRQKSSWQHTFRSKYIVRPERILVGGVHFVWQHEYIWSDVFVSDSLALLNHYRSCCGVQQTWFLHLFSFDVLTDTIIADNHLIQHKNAILNHKLMRSFLSRVMLLK
ncbi:uncharacterized protein LOC129225226 [Uloborus diversus]|uniref:uncharacterized protein LOC129225226 n=1 Tax=Uloborus diversus TaxID=327109 RepID=UPI00240A10EE|nr:uncharacterized protein LOC129225226 [Uloborus diversus]XP_054715774.1 uncharacterized protein LOC129225226 [Uloborus diversus]